MGVGGKQPFFIWPLEDNSQKLPVAHSGGQGNTDVIHQGGAGGKGGLKAHGPFGEAFAVGVDRGGDADREQLMSQIVRAKERRKSHPTPGWTHFSGMLSIVLASESVVRS